MRNNYLMVGIITVSMMVVAGMALAQGSSAPADEQLNAEPAGEPAKEPVATPAPVKKEEIKIKTKISDLPEPVQKVVKKQTKGIKNYTLAKATMGIETIFELKMKVKGLAKEIEIDADGNFIKVEQEVKLATLPAKVKKGLATAAGKGKILKVKSITKGAAVTYEATVKTGKETSNVVVGANGAMVQ
jgi:hypothetical protein